LTLNEYSDLASIFGSLAVIGVFVQAILIRGQIKKDHERSRREKSVELLGQWAKHLKQDSSLARRIVESLNEEESRNLFNQEETKVAVKYEESLRKILDLGDDELNKPNGEVILNAAQSSKLRWHAMSYLNMLESILVAWQYSIVDREIIEHQFSYLFSPEQGHAALKHFRTAAGGEKAFPAIEIFANHLEENRRLILKQKANVA